MSVEATGNNIAGNQGLITYGLNGIRHVVEGALTGLSYGVRTVCHLPVAALKGAIERCQEKGLPRVAIEVGEVCLGGAVFVELNRLRTQLESRSLWQNFQGLAFVFLAVQTYRYSGQVKALADKVSRLSPHPSGISTPIRGRAGDSPVVLDLQGHEVPRPPKGFFNALNTSFHEAMQNPLSPSSWWSTST